MLKRSPLKKNKNYTLKKSPLKRGNTRLKVCNKSEEQLAVDKLKKEKRTAFYNECTEKSTGVSDISGARIGSGRIFFHHCLPKSTYGDIEYSHKIIIRVTTEEHGMLESDLYCFKEAEEKIKFALENYYILQQESLEWENKYEKNNRSEVN